MGVVAVTSDLDEFEAGNSHPRLQLPSAFDCLYG